MLKHILILVLFSAVVVFCTPQIQPFIHVLVSAHDWVSQILLQLFAGGEAGNIARHLLALIAIPLLFGIIPASVYWLAKRRRFPYFADVIWVTWLIQTTAIVILYKNLMP